MNDPYTLDAGPRAEPELGAQPDYARGGAAATSRRSLTGTGSLRFVMAIVNTRIVRRSNALLD